VVGTWNGEQIMLLVNLRTLGLLPVPVFRLLKGQCQRSGLCTKFYSLPPNLRANYTM